jgi:hypothetical protein
MTLKYQIITCNSERIETDKMQSLQFKSFCYVDCTVTCHYLISGVLEMYISVDYTSFVGACLLHCFRKWS